MKIPSNTTFQRCFIGCLYDFCYSPLHKFVATRMGKGFTMEYLACVHSFWKRCSPSRKHWLMGCKLRNGPVGGWEYRVSACRQVIVFSMPWSTVSRSWRCRNKNRDDGWVWDFFLFYFFFFFFNTKRATQLYNIYLSISVRWSLKLN